MFSFSPRGGNKVQGRTMGTGWRNKRKDSASNSSNRRGGSCGTNKRGSKSMKNRGNEGSSSYTEPHDLSVTYSGIEVSLSQSTVSDAAVVSVAHDDSQHPHRQQQQRRPQRSRTGAAPASPAAAPAKTGRGGLWGKSHNQQRDGAFPSLTNEKAAAVTALPSSTRARAPAAHDQRMQFHQEKKSRQQQPVVRSVVSLQRTRMEAHRVYQRCQFGSDPADAATTTTSTTATTATGEGEEQRMTRNDVRNGAGAATAATSSALERFFLSSTSDDTQKITTTKEFQRVSPVRRHKPHPSWSYAFVLDLLRNAPVHDEMTLLLQEKDRCDAELVRMQTDRDRLFPAVTQELPQQHNGAKLAAASTTALSSPDLLPRMEDCNGRLLYHKATHKHRTITATDRQRYQSHRGTCLTVCFLLPTHSKSLEALQSKCAALKHSPAAMSNNNNISRSKGAATATTIRPVDCREGGAAASIQHVALLPDGGFFLSRDNRNGNNRHPGTYIHTDGGVSNNSSKSRNSSNHSSSDNNKISMRLSSISNTMLYLSTGSCGEYFGKQVNGTSVWCVQDDDLHGCLQHLHNVQRVVFGPTTTTPIFNCTDEPNRQSYSSWIVLSEDVVLWKNVPARMHSKLLLSTIPSPSSAPLSFNSSSNYNINKAVVDVALGANGSYFMLFADGALLVDFLLRTNVPKCSPFVLFSFLCSFVGINIHLL
jgi:hypothetical protein